jgi:hypothetical protein
MVVIDHQRGQELVKMQYDYSLLTLASLDFYFLLLLFVKNLHEVYAIFRNYRHLQLYNS